MLLFWDIDALINDFLNFKLNVFPSGSNLLKLIIYFFILRNSFE